jgi:hypothetical protein
VVTPISSTRKILANSVFLFAAYVSAAYTYMLITAAICWLLGQKAIPTYNEILNLNKDFDYWSRLRIIAAFGTAPVLMFITSLVLFGFSRIRFNVRPMRFFLFWLSIAYLNFFFANLVIVPAAHLSFYWGAFQGFATIAAWFYLPFGVGAVFSVVGLLLAIGFGFLVRKRFFRYYFPIDKDDNLAVSIGRGYFKSMFWYPLLLTSIPLLLITNAYSISLHVAILTVYLFFGIGLSIQKQNNFVLDGDTDHNVYRHIFKLPKPE